MSQTVYLSFQGDTALIEIDNPPVNALSQSVRAGLLDALDKAEADPAINVIALLGRGKVFIAGADIKEFGKPPQSPILPDVIARLERSDKAVIGILHGVALGGGLEVALGCHYRVALNDTRLGLPEVKLGLLPGAGGTQRMPRLTGLASATDWITWGELVDAQTALTSGLIDAISDANTAQEAALTVARQWKEDRIVLRKTGDLPNARDEGNVIDNTRQQLLESCPELYSPFRILDALEASCTLPLAEGLARERGLFFQCMESPQRAGLIHHFFASKAIGKVPGADAPADITRVVVTGDHPAVSALTDQPLVERSESGSPGLKVWFQPENTTRPDTPVRVALIDPVSVPAEADTDFSLLLIPQTKWAELIDHGEQPDVQQALIKLLKSSGLSIVPSKGRSIYSALRDKQKGATVDRNTLEQAALSIWEAGLCYRGSDIDVIATETLGYPKHLGGPYLQVTAKSN
ncbi:enoyl-CoA hydratase/isomerase family protein [Saccharospirillum impatiens]|uniref:enoyl-CoA hydratase/isomerase family protein n=1 Tax=Saccharospirillum impatiens TaxID=169438 RepID=UPI00041665DE|nr:enoyl-CoA hydratase/isomerase family protein [Saccharospirillum impatiens]